MIGCGSDGAAEAPIRRLRITIANKGFEGIGCTLERLAGQVRGAGLSTKRHCAPKQGETVFGKIRFDRRAERRRIRRQYTVFPHQRPCRAAIQEASEDAIDGRVRQESCQLVNRLQGLPPPGTWPR